MQGLEEGDGVSNRQHRELDFTKKIRGIRKCLRSVYLQTHGEVAERLKAAVC